MVVHFIERLHVQLVILEGIGHAVVLPGRSDPESHDLGVPVDFTERAGGSPLLLRKKLSRINLKARLTLYITANIYQCLVPHHLEHHGYEWHRSHTATGYYTGIS